MNIFLIIQAVLGLLLVITILLQKSGTDGLSGLSGNPTSPGIVSAATVASFLTKTTICLAVLFIGNSLLLANLSYSKGDISIADKIQSIEKNASDKSNKVNKAEKLNIAE